VPAIAERLPAKYLVKEEAPKTISCFALQFQKPGNIGFVLLSRLGHRFHVSPAVFF
jgi:hypothetical protein